MKYLLRHFSAHGATVVDLGTRMVLVGSAVDCDILVRTLSGSIICAKIEPDADGYSLEILQKGIVRHNGEKIKKSALNPGDRIEVGGEVLIYDFAVPAPAQSKEDPRTNLYVPLHALIESVAQERDLQKLLTRLMGKLVELFNGSSAFIFKLDRDELPQMFASTTNGEAGNSFSDTIVQNVIRNKRGIFLENALSDPDFSQSHSIADLKLTSVVCAPIIIAGSLIGVVYIGSKKATVSFTGKDLEILTIYAAISGMLIHHVEYICSQNKAIRALTDHNSVEGFVADSKVMQNVLATVHSLAVSDITLLIEGPTGTGKNHVAEIVHKKSRRSKCPFLVVNCSSLRGDLLESELFGHKKGSFTGAMDDHAGLFAAAKGGTLVLDEVGELDMSVQAKLLRVLENNVIRPVGSTKEVQIDVRIICATNRDLQSMVVSGTFRNDLFYRINQFCIKVPPLCERGDDVVLLAYFFLEKYKAHYPAKEVVDFHPETLNYIRYCDWPGNIRELSNTIHRAVLSNDGPLVHIPRTTACQDPVFNFETATEAFQRDLIIKAIKRTSGNKEEAARLLGLSRSTFFRYQSGLDVDASIKSN